MSVFAKVEGDSRFLSMVEKDGGWYRVANRIAASAAKVTSSCIVQKSYFWNRNLCWPVAANWMTLLKIYDPWILEVWLCVKSWKTGSYM